MTDVLKMILAYMGRGLKDSIVGTWKVFQLDGDTDTNLGSSQAHKEHPTSTLARRRAERSKQKEPKVDK